MTKTRICVYCGSRLPESTGIITLAKQVGDEIAKRNWGLVYGGGKVGIMGVIADSVLDQNGEVIGIIPTALKKAEVVHTGVTQVIETLDMHSRKAKMEKLSDAFVILPGGFGTLDEFFEILTWKQLGFHSKPIILVNQSGYFDGLTQFLDTAIGLDFIKETNRSLFQITKDSNETLELLDTYF